MNVTIKKVLVGGMALAAVGTLVACGSSTESGKGSKTLTVGYWKGSDTENAAFNTLVKNFEKENNAKVDAKIYTDITTQMPTDFAGGTAPDVFYMDSSFYPYLQSQGVLQPLTSVEPSDYYDSLAKAFTTDGKFYGAPKDTSTLALYINEDIMKKAGISVDEIPTSYEEFITWAPGAQAKLDAAYGEGKVYVMNVNADMNRQWMFISADNQNPIKDDGNGQSDISNATIAKNMETVIKMFNTGAVATPKDVGAGDEGTGFATGKYMMIETGNWNYNVFNTQYKDLHFTVKPMMTYKSKQMTMNYSVGWGMNKDAKAKDLGDKWIAYVAGDEGQQIWTEATGTLPTRPTVAEKSEMLSKNPLLKIHSDEIEYGVTWQDGINVTTVAASYLNFIPNAFKKDATVSDLTKTLAEIDEDANSKLAK